MVIQSQYFKYYILCSLLFIFLACSKSTDPNSTLDANHFDFILYDGLTEQNIQSVSENLEYHYQRILDDLQIKNVPIITVKIWSDYNNFLDAMENDIGTRYNGATGYIYDMKELRIFYNSDVAVAAVHEFAHIVSMYVNSTIPNNPRWLWEAVALYENNEFVDPQTLWYLASGNFPTLEDLNTDYNLSNHYIYSVGYVLLEYIVEGWGMQTVISLIKTNGNIQTVLGVTEAQFEAGWYQYLEDNYL